MNDLNPAADENADDKSAGVKRRNIVAGAAWSVPVFAAAVAVPLATASEASCTLVDGVLDVAYPKRPTGTGSVLPFSIPLAGPDTSGVAFTVTFTEVIDEEAPGGGEEEGETPEDPEAQPPGSLPIAVPSSGVSNSSGVIEFTVAQGGVGNYTMTVTAEGCGVAETLIAVAYPAEHDLLWWGRGGYRNIGNGSNANSLIPTSPSFPSSAQFKDVGGSFNTSFAVGANGALWAWGLNQYGTFGQTHAHSNLPVSVPLPAGVQLDRILDTSGYFGLAITTDGELYSWGTNVQGTTGRNATSGIAIPGPIPELDSVTQADGGYRGGIAIDGGKVKAWGRNAEGQATGTAGGGSAVVVPIEVTYFSSIPVVDVAAGSHSRFVVSADGDLYSWGYDGSGALGNGSGGSRRIPAIVPRYNGQDYKRVWANYYTGIALLGDGTLVGWGYNGYGKIGNGTTATQQSPVPAFVGVTDIVDVAISYYGIHVLTASGAVYYAGYNGQGQSGSGAVGGSFRTPVRVFGISNGSAIGATYWSAGALNG